MSLTSTPQAGSDGGRTSTSPLHRVDQPETSDEAAVPDRGDEAELLDQGGGTNKEQQLRLGMSRVPENDGAAQRSEPHPCRGGNVNLTELKYLQVNGGCTIECCEKYKSFKLKIPQPDSERRHSLDFRTVFEIMIGPFSFCEIGKT